jgi:hypothetical protein
VIAPGFATPVTVKVVELGTLAIALSAKLYPTGVLPTLATWSPTARPCAAEVVYVIVPPFGEDHAAFEIVKTEPTPVTVKLVALGTAATVLSTKL